MGKRILTGDVTSHGQCTGTARVITSVAEVADFQEGEVLVTHNTNPLFNAAMMKASGIITEIGGFLNHTSIVARELGIPAIVNAKEATRLIQTGQKIILNADGEGGFAYESD